MIYFLFCNQKINKIFYYLLGRLDVFLFISSLSGSIKFPLPFSFYNARDRNSVFLIIYVKKKFFFQYEDFFGPISPGCCFSVWWREGVKERGTQGHMFAEIGGWQGEVLNKKNIYLQCCSLLWGCWSLWWWRSGCAGLRGKYYCNLLCGFFPRIYDKKQWSIREPTTLWLPFSTQNYMSSP